MAARSSTSSRSRASSQGMLLLCSHGEKPVLRISGTKENPGRRFWGCVYFEVQEGCNFFHWADPETEVEYSEIARVSLKQRNSVSFH
ncbi:DNA-(apurinic or apyrimidinic site) lyase [Arachis hypogaea]|nr:DNA-(apurinic or apyrimidinic site) lyase [Arachis hypogaea]